METLSEHDASTDSEWNAFLAETEEEISNYAQQLDQPVDPTIVRYHTPNVANSTASAADFRKSAALNVDDLLNELTTQSKAPASLESLSAENTLLRQEQLVTLEKLAIMQEQLSRYHQRELERLSISPTPPTMESSNTAPNMNTEQSANPMQLHLDDLQMQLSRQNLELASLLQQNEILRSENRRLMLLKGQGNAVDLSAVADDAVTEYSRHWFKVFMRNQPVFVKLLDQVNADSDISMAQTLHSKLSAILKCYGDDSSTWRPDRDQLPSIANEMFHILDLYINKQHVREEEIKRLEISLTDKDKKIADLRAALINAESHLNETLKAFQHVFRPNDVTSTARIPIVACSETMRQFLSVWVAELDQLRNEVDRGRKLVRQRDSEMSVLRQAEARSRLVSEAPSPAPPITVVAPTPPPPSIPSPSIPPPLIPPPSSAPIASQPSSPIPPSKTFVPPPEWIANNISDLKSTSNTGECIELLMKWLDESKGTSDGLTQMAVVLESYMEASATIKKERDNLKRVLHELTENMDVREAVWVQKYSEKEREFKSLLLRSQTMELVLRAYEEEFSQILALSLLQDSAGKDNTKPKTGETVAPSQKFPDPNMVHPFPFIRHFQYTHDCYLSANHSLARLKTQMEQARSETRSVAVERDALRMELVVSKKRVHGLEFESEEIKKKFDILQHSVEEIHRQFDQALERNATLETKMIRIGQAFHKMVIS
jgi:hypothetical protein